MNDTPTAGSSRDRLRQSERLRQQTAGHRPIAVHVIGVVPLSVAAIFVEQPELVTKDASSQEAAVHHHANVAARREKRRDARAVDEVQVRGTGVFVEAERTLNLPAITSAKPYCL